MTSNPPRHRGATKPAEAADSHLVPTKTDRLRKLLERPRGATLAELATESGWQPHSTRAWLTGLRKKNRDALLRETRRNGESCYRLAASA